MSKHSNCNDIPKVGQKRVFEYPVQNKLGEVTAVETREIIVTEVCDTSKTPIDAAAIAAKPLLRRGRWLITGWDVRRGGIRSFYWDWNSPRPIKLALFADGEKVADGETFPPTLAGSAVLGETCRKYVSSQPGGGGASRFKLAAVTA